MKTIISSLIPADTTPESYQACRSSISLFKSSIIPQDVPSSYKFISDVAVNYFNSTKGGLLDQQSFDYIVSHSSIPQEEKVNALALFSNFSREPIPYPTTLFHVQTFNKEKEAAWIAEKQALAMHALEHGFTDPKTKIRYEGPEGSKLILQSILYENPYMKLKEQVAHTEGDVLHDIDEVLEAYDSRKQGLSDAIEGLKTGYTKIDEVAGAIKAGDLALVIAATAECKSMFAMNIAYNAVTEQGKSGIIFTAETSRDVYRRRFLARHTCNAIFGNPLGLDSNKIRDASLSVEEEAQFIKSVKDLNENPSYGYLNICQVTRGATISSIFDKAEAINKEHKLDFIIIDYLELLTPERKKSSRREEIEEMLIASKERALTFDNGRGISLINLHQAKQEARESVKPEAGKFYTCRDAAHTSEAAKSSDLMIALLLTDELRQANEICCGILKCRDGELCDPFKLFTNLASGYIGNLA